MAGVAVALLAGTTAATAQPDYRRLELEVIREHNLARTKPRDYAAHLRELRRYYDGRFLARPGQTRLLTHEGIAALDEAIRFLERQPATPALLRSEGMSHGARDHVEDRGPTAELGHVGSDGSRPWDRIARYGTWLGTAAENIAYGPATGREVVVQLIIDDGVHDRGHRTNIFTGAFRVAGVACGPHVTYLVMCVVTYAEGYEEAEPGANSQQPPRPTPTLSLRQQGHPHVPIFPQPAARGVTDLIGREPTYQRLVVQ